MKSSILGTFTAIAGIILLALAGPVTAQRPTKTFAKRGLGAGDSFPFEDADAASISMSMMSESSLVAAPTKDDADSSSAPSKVATKAQKSTKASKSTKSTKSQPTVPTHVHQDFWADAIVDLTHEAVDVNSDGTIDEDELSKSLNMMAAKKGLPPALISGMFKFADIDGDKKIDPLEFASIVATTQTPCKAREKIVSVSTAYACGDSANPTTTSTKVYYPEPNAESGFEKYPVVLFHRGSGGWAPHDEDCGAPGYGYDNWLKQITRQCLIVIAPMTSRDVNPSDDCKRDRDLLNVYKYAKIKTNWDNWGIGVTPDWERLGGVGHSSGGHHLPLFQMDLHNLPSSPKLSAAVYSHAGGTAVTDPKPKHTDLQTCLAETDSPCAWVPSFFLTQHEDKKVTPEMTHRWFELLSYQPYSVFAELGEDNGGVCKPTGHMEPISTSLLGSHTGRFLACHLFDYTDPDPIVKARTYTACRGVYSKDPLDGGSKICNAIKSHDHKGKAAGICEGFVL